MDEHPLFSVGEGWTTAGRLKAGDEIRDFNFQQLRIVAIELDDNPTKVHNLEIADAQTYFAGGLEAWGHNTRNPTKATKNAAIACATGSDGVLRCEFCGVPLTLESGFKNSLEFDHGTPYSKGGGRDISNLFCSCRTCNRQKGASDFGDWLRRQGI